MKFTQSQHVVFLVFNATLQDSKFYLGRRKLWQKLIKPHNTLVKKLIKPRNTLVSVTVYGNSFVANPSLSHLNNCIADCSEQIFVFMY